MKSKFVSFSYKSGEDQLFPQRDGLVGSLLHRVGRLPDGLSDISAPPVPLPVPEVVFRLRETVLDGHNSSAGSFPQYDLLFPVGNNEEETVVSWLSGNANGFRGKVSESLRKAVSSTVMNAVNRYFGDAAQANCFTSPFFAAVALRLSGGHHAFVGPPVLMIPASRLPAVRINAWSVADGELATNVSIINRPCRLQMKVNDVSEDIALNASIESVDILVTSQVPLYDASSECFGLKNSSPGGIIHTGRESQLLTSRCRGWDIACFSEERIAAEAVMPRPFYMAARYSPRDFIALADTGGFIDMNWNCGCLAGICHGSPLNPDYSALKRFSGASYLFNTRLSVCSPEITLPLPFSLPASVPYWESTPGSGLSGYSVGCEATVESGGIPSCLFPLLEADASDSLPDFSDWFPRYLFFPDTSADEMIVSANGSYYRLPLVKSPELDGSYYFRGFGDSLPEVVPGEYRPHGEGRTFHDSCRLHTSPPAAHSLFPRGLATSFGSEVIALAFSMRAASGGQLGEFPLYCFTADGIWLLGGDAGKPYSALQMISRDRLKDCRHAVSTETGAAYVSPRGLMLLEGASTRLVARREVIPDGAVLSYDPSCRRILVKDDGESCICHYLSDGVTVRLELSSGSAYEHEMRTLPITLGQPEAYKNIRNMKLRGCLKTIVNGSEFAECNDYGRDHEHFVGRFSRFFIVSAQPSEVFKPCKGSLHDPSFLGRDKLS